MSGLYASSRAPDAWQLLLGFGPLTRAELARARDVTKRTASQGADALVKASLATLRAGDGALQCIDAQHIRSETPAKFNQTAEPRGR